MTSRFVQEPGGWSKPVMYALVLHVVIAVFLFAGFRFTRNQEASSSVMQAVVVRDSQQEQPQPQPPAPDPAKAQEEERKRREAEQQQRKEQEAEAQRRATEAERVKAESERKKLDEEKKRQAEIQQKKAEADRKEAERKKLEEADRQKKAAEADKRKRDEERQKRDRQQAEDALRQQMAEEEQSRAATAKAARLAPLIDKYKAAIAQKVQRHWAPPVASRKGLKATVHVRQTPSGEVLEARVVKSSGDPIFDRSVESAVYKASPLPLPENPEAFDREIEFIFDPDKAKGGLE